MRVVFRRPDAVPRLFDWLFELFLVFRRRRRNKKEMKPPNISIAKPTATMVINEVGSVKSGNLLLR